MLLSTDYKCDFLFWKLNGKIQNASFVQTTIQKSECLLKLSEPIKSPVWTGSLLKTSISCEISGTYLSGAGQKHHFCGVTVSDPDGNYYCHNKNSLSTCSRTSKIFGYSLVLKVWKGWGEGFYFLFLFFFLILFVSFESVLHYLRWNVPAVKQLQILLDLVVLVPPQNIRPIKQLLQ